VVVTRVVQCDLSDPIGAGVIHSLAGHQSSKVCEHAWCCHNRSGSRADWSTSGYDRFEKTFLIDPYGQLTSSDFVVQQLAKQRRLS
jgi:hypothetical protein